jgi:Spy/CpxP family protein refolding chaperone
MKNLICTFLLVFFTLSVMAQGQRKNYDQEKYESAKVAFVTNRLDLKPEQAERFWPVYNKYTEERRSMMKEISMISKEGTESINENKAKELLEKKFNLQQKLLTREKEFYSEITKFISAQQALKLTEINKEFARLLYRKNQEKIN